jgi:hypothetical protein
MGLAREQGVRAREDFASFYGPRQQAASRRLVARYRPTITAGTDVVAESAVAAELL